MAGTLRDRIDESVRSIRGKTRIVPQFAIVLGTGLGGFSQGIADSVTIPYSEIPHFPVSTVMTHKGELVCGVLEGKPVVVMDGRFHHYEGWSLDQITFPVRVMKKLGASVLIITNIAGGMNPLHDIGDIIIIDDHINLMGMNPLIGPNDDELGPRFPDMCRPYDAELMGLAEQVAMDEGIRFHRGVYVALTGPSLETRAEYRFLGMMGADIVGMSTVPEVIVAVHAGFRILGISCVTDKCLPDCLKPINIEEIIKVANQAEKKMTRIIRQVVGRAAI